MSSPITVLLADDHAMVREMLRDRLQAELDIAVVGVVETADQAVTRALELRPTVVVLDIDMPGLLSFDAARTIKSHLPDTSVIFLSAFFHDRYIEEALAAEVSGYVTKTEPTDSIVQAVRDAVSGAAYFSPEVRARIVVDSGGTRLAQTTLTRSSTLTRRELEVLRYIAKGLAKKEIAETLHLSVKTVERHSDNLMRKLDIHDRVELARHAIREGLAGL